MTEPTCHYCGASDKLRCRNAKDAVLCDMYPSPKRSCDFIFFWGHNRKRIGDKAVFSQWYRSDFFYDGQVFPTAEHWMMFQKARLFKDGKIAREIINNPYPGEVKNLGRQVKGFDESVWDSKKRDIVWQGNLLKFSQSTELEAILFNTGDHVLVEASPYDPVWGIGLGENEPEAQIVPDWQGENLLGFILMDVRDALRYTKQTNLLRGPGTWQIKATERT